MWPFFKGGYRDPWGLGNGLDFSLFPRLPAGGQRPSCQLLHPELCREKGTLQKEGESGAQRGWGSGSPASWGDLVTFSDSEAPKRFSRAPGFGSVAQHQPFYFALCAPPCPTQPPSPEKREVSKVTVRTSGQPEKIGRLWTIGAPAHSLHQAQGPWLGESPPKGLGRKWGPVDKKGPERWEPQQEDSWTEERCKAGRTGMGNMERPNMDRSSPNLGPPPALLLSVDLTPLALPLTRG